MKGQERFFILIILTAAWTAKVVRRTLPNLSSLELTFESEKMETSSSDLDASWAVNLSPSGSPCSFALGYIAVVAWVASYKGLYTPVNDRL
jgi:hypothetical protein